MQKKFPLVLCVGLVFCLFCFMAIVPGCEKGNKISGPDNDASVLEIPAQLNDGWETASVESVGLNPGIIGSMADELSNRTDHLYHGVVICKDSKLVFEQYFSGYDRHNVSSVQSGITHYAADTLHYLASVTKSVTSTLMGIAIDIGFVEDVDLAVMTFFPECHALFTGGKENITIANCLSMSSGLPWDESSYSYSDPRNDLRAMLSSGRPFYDFFRNDLIAAPGTEFLYSSGDSNVLGEIIHRSYEAVLADFAERYLFGPLEIRDHHWRQFTYAPGVTYASGGLSLRPRDMAKLGQLFLNKGIWDGERIVSETWIDASIEESIPLPAAMQGPFHSFGYGYQWWLETFDSGTIAAYSARGHGNQYIIVIPELNIVIVLTGGAYHMSPLYSPITWHGLVEDYILPALE